MDLVSSTSFQTLVTRHKGDYKVKDFSCWKQFLWAHFKFSLLKSAIWFKFKKQTPQL